MNIASSRLTDDQRIFIEEYAALLAPWGLPPASGRVCGYTLLQQKPVSLDQIAADLEMSKAGAWNAAKVLERCGHVRRYGEPGSKRAMYAASHNYASILAEHCAMWGDMGALLQNSASTVATGAAADRLQEMGRFFVALRARIEQAIGELKAEPPRAEA
jgi:hypothetical protein